MIAVERVLNHLNLNGYYFKYVYDIGANKGSWTAACQKLLPESKFVLFEANPDITIFDNERHLYYNCILSCPEMDEVDFYSVGGTGDSYYKEKTSVYGNTTPIKKKTITLDEMVEQHDIPVPQFMKLDNQGSELDILEGASETIKHVDVLLTELPVLPYNIGAPNFNDYLEVITDLGFVPLRLVEDHLVQNLLTQLDILFVRKEIKDQYYRGKGVGYDG